MISITPQKLIKTLRTLWAIIWTAATIMSIHLDPKVAAAIHLSSPPLPLVLPPQGHHPVSLEYSAGWTVGTIGRSTKPIMYVPMIFRINILDTKIPEKIISSKMIISAQSGTPSYVCDSLAGTRCQNDRFALPVLFTRVTRRFT